MNVNLKRAESRYQTNQQFDASSANHPQRAQVAGGGCGEIHVGSFHPLSKRGCRFTNFHS
ncbi:MAG: hypothetical protein MR508_03665 [Lachnospiraceae bacterium]|nr:hypothetical protein [Lachnospiraceae bacterium]